MAKKSEIPLLTQAEAEMMTALWKVSCGSVRDIMGQLPSTRKMAYTSAATVLKILEEKGHVGSEKEGNVLVYVPLLKQEQYKKNTLRHIVSQFFEGTPSSLVKNLISDESLSEEEKAEIRKLIKEL